MGMDGRRLWLSSVEFARGSGAVQTSTSVWGIMIDINLYYTCRLFLLSTSLQHVCLLHLTCLEFARELLIIRLTVGYESVYSFS
jgi:hypothetical protein